MSKVKALQFFHALRQIAIIFTNVLLAKSILSQSDIGFFEMLFFVGYSVTFFWVSGFIQGLLTTHPKLQQKEKGAVFFQMYLLFLGISSLIAVVLYVGQVPIAQALTQQDYIPHYELFIVYLLFNIPTYLVENFYLLKEKPWAIVNFGLLSFGGHISVILVPVFMGWGLEWSFYGLIALAIIKHIWLWSLLIQISRPQWTPILLKPFLLVAAPLVGYALMGGFAQIFDNWLVTWFYEGDEKMFAIFRYGARELPLALALANSFSTAMLPEVAKDVPTAIIDIKNKSRKLFHILFPLSILGLLLSYPLFPIIFNPDFLPSATVFNVYLLIIISRLVFPHTILIGLGKTTFVLWVSIVELLLNIVASLIFISWWGLAGIAMGTVVAYAFEKIVYVFYLNRHLDIRFGDYTDLRWFWAYSLVLVTVFLLVEL